MLPEIILEEINALMRSSNLPEDTRRRLFGSADLFLRTDELSVFNFTHPRRKHGTKIKKLTFDKKDGIPQDEFVSIHESLYNESLKVDDAVQKVHGE